MTEKRPTGIWEAYKHSRTIRIDLGELDPILKDFWVQAMPTSAYEPSVSLAMEAMTDTGDQNRQAMGLWIENWNLVDNSGEPLPTPRDDPAKHKTIKDENGKTSRVKESGARWEDILPFEVQTFIIRKISKVDEERLAVPTVCASSS